MEKLAKDTERPDSCLHCQELLTQTEGLVAEFQHWRLLVSRDQGYLGRTMLITKRHIENVSGLTFAENDELLDIQVSLEAAVRKALGASWCNWEQLGNDAFQADEPAPHLHYHLRPRYQEAVTFAGKTFSDPAFGHRADSAQRWNVDQDPEYKGWFKDRLAAAIRAELS